MVSQVFFALCLYCPYYNVLFETNVNMKVQSLSNSDARAKQVATSSQLWAGYPYPAKSISVSSLVTTTENVPDKAVASNHHIASASNGCLM